MGEDTQLRYDVKGKNLHALLREFRRQQGLSRKQAAEAWGLSARTIETWEHGRAQDRTGLYKERLEKVFKREQIRLA